MAVREPIRSNYFVAPAFEQVVAIAFGKYYEVSSSTIVIFLYVASAGERVLTVGF